MWVSRKEGELERERMGSHYTAPTYLGVTLSSGKLALSLLRFPKGSQPCNLTDISLSDASLGTQVHPLWAFIYKWNGKPQQHAFPPVSIPLVHALLAAGSRDRENICFSWKNAAPTDCAGDRPCLKLVLKRVPMPTCGLQHLQSHQSPLSNCAWGHPGHKSPGKVRGIARAEETTIRLRLPGEQWLALVGNRLTDGADRL